MLRLIGVPLSCEIVGLSLSCFDFVALDSCAACAKINGGATKTQAPPPDVSKLPEGELLGVTVVLLTCSYRNQEFIRVGKNCVVLFL